MAKLITIDEAAERTGHAVRTLYKWRYSKPRVGPRSARVGGRVMYREAEVDEWIAEQFAEDERMATG